MAARVWHRSGRYARGDRTLYQQHCFEYGHVHSACGDRSLYSRKSVDRGKYGSGIPKTAGRVCGWFEQYSRNSLPETSRSVLSFSQHRGYGPHQRAIRRSFADRSRCRRSSGNGFRRVRRRLSSLVVCQFTTQHRIGFGTNPQFRETPIGRWLATGYSCSTASIRPALTSFGRRTQSSRLFTTKFRQTNCSALSVTWTDLSSVVAPQ